MNKKSIIGLVLIFAIFIGYMKWMSPSQEELAAMRAKQDSIMQAYADSIAVVDSLNQVRAELEKRAAEGDSVAMAQLHVKPVSDLNLGAFNASLNRETGTVTMENGNIVMSVSTQGAMVQSVIVKDYLTFDSMPLQLITPGEDNMNLVFSTEDNRVVNTRDLTFVPYLDGEPIGVNDNLTVVGEDAVLSLRAPVLGTVDSSGVAAIAEDSYLEFRYTLPSTEYDPDADEQATGYEVGFDIVFHNLDGVVQSTPYMDFQWHNTMVRQEKVDQSMKNARNRQKDPERLYTNLYYKPTKDHADELRQGRVSDEKKVKTPVEWVAYKQQFFTAILMCENDSVPFENADLALTTNTEDTADNYLVDMSSTIGLTYNGGNTEIPMQFYFGPSKYRDLRDQHRGFERMLPLGWGFFLIQWFNRFVLIPVFNFFEGFGWNYGIIIIMLTILLKIILFPLTYKTYQTSAIMRILKPELDALNKKYPNQDQMMQKQQAMQRLQKSAGINPMAGCLPMLIQMPILFAMYRFFPASIELRQQSFLWADDLSTYDSILDLGFNIPMYGDHVSLFCLLMFAMQMIYTVYTMQSQGTQGMPGMKFMMYFMPFMMLFIFNSQSAALNLYYFLNLALTMLQMMLIRQFTSEKRVRARMVAYENNLKTKPQKKSKFQKRLEEMQKMSEQMQKQQQQQRR